MKICWDNLENLVLTKQGNFRDIMKKRTYYYENSCENCNEPFLREGKGRKYCSVECIKRNKEERTDDVKRKISKSQKGENNSCWRGGYYSNGIPAYDTFTPQIEWCEEVRRNKNDSNVLEVKCFRCNEWFIPTLNNVNGRIQHLRGRRNGERRFYCSNQCKNSCSIFGKSANSIMKEDVVRAGRLKWLELVREVQPELREIVLERDKYKCVKCDSINDLQCHHILPVNIEPLLSADIDNCITLCEKCHIKAHKKDGCRYNQLKIKEC
jgi:hypothetical protein